MSGLTVGLHDRRHPVAAVFASALTGTDCHVEWVDEGLTPLPMARWRRTANASDRALLAHCVGATLDVGCGPGRMAEHLVARCHRVLALDIVPEAAALAARRGLDTLVGDVFDPLPHEGEWDTALLADGNIGIGGDPAALLARLRGLLRPGGRVVVDLDPPGRGIRTGRARLHTNRHSSRSFPWAAVAADAIEPLATGAGLADADVRRHGSRWFAVLSRRS